MNLTAFFALLGGLLVLAFAANRLFRLTRVPDVLVLLGTGLLLGPVLGWADASRFEPMTHAFGTLALILILFEGGLELDVRQTLRHFPGGLVLGFLTYTLTFLLISAFTHWSLNVPVTRALLVGGVLGCTSAAVVLPVLQQLNARPPVKVTLLLEASLGDVLGVLTVGVLVQYSLHGGPLMKGFVLGLLGEILISMLLAIVAGIAWSKLLPLLSEQRFWHVLTFSVVLLLYAAAEATGGSGLIAALGFGLTLANFPGIDRRMVKTTFELEAATDEHHQQILTFHSELAFLVRTFFFVLLGIVVKIGGLKDYLLFTLGILAVIFVARWLAVQASRWSWRDILAHERETVLWILPRGLITAVLAIQVVETVGKEFAMLPVVAFAIILLTNVVLVLGAVRGRRTAGAVQEGAPAEPLTVPDSSGLKSQ